MKKTFLLIAGLTALTAVGCAPPKILVGHAYASSDKSIETLIVKSGATVGSGDNEKNLFNVYMRVCNQDAANNTTACKDTLILSNVNPDSI